MQCGWSELLPAMVCVCTLVVVIHGVVTYWFDYAKQHKTSCMHIRVVIIRYASGGVQQHDCFHKL